MSDVEIEGQRYRCGQLPTRTQLHVVMRLAPVLRGLLPIFTMSQQQLVTDEATGAMVPDLAAMNTLEVIAALTNTIGMMSDADADYVLDRALDCVRWRQGDRWMPLRAPGGAFMNGAADRLDVQLRLLWEVLRESLANFSLANVLPSQTENGLDQTAQTAA